MREETHFITELNETIWKMTVAGADDLYEKFSRGTNHTTVEVIVTDVDVIGLYVKHSTSEMFFQRLQ